MRTGITHTLLITNFLVSTAALTLSAESVTARQLTIFVNHAATGQNDGTSWANAYTTLQDAIATSNPGDAVWIAEGTYRPDEGQNQTPGDRAATFLISHDLSVYGGFSGTETALEERDMEANETILSGDLLGNDGEVFDPESPLRGDNVERLLLLASEESKPFSVLLGGLTIQGGHATGEFNVPVQRFSEIIYSQLGGGIYVASNADLTVRRTLFRYNHARTCGGGIFSTGRLIVKTSVFSENNASSPSISDGGRCDVGTGGGIAIDGNDRTDLWLDISDSLFERNTGGWDCGGALAVGAANARITGTRIKENEAAAGAGICLSGGFLSMSHLVMEGNRGFEGDDIITVAGALFIVNAKARLHGSLVVGNGSSSTRASGGAIWFERSSILYVTNSTIADNEAVQGDGMAIDKQSTVFFHNSILHNDSIVADDTRSTVALPHAFFSEYSILNGELPEFTALGAGIQQGVDPLFDENYYLLPGSPAVDAGANVLVPADTFDVDMDGDTSEPVPLDLAGNPRFVMQEGSAPNRTVDLGPFEMPFTATSIVESFPGETSNACPLVTTYPNPASTELTAELSAPGNLELLDVLGRRVAEWKRQPAGTSRLDVSTIPGGSYFMQYTGDDASRRCLVPLVIMN